MLGMDRLARGDLGEVERRAVLDRDGEERPEPTRRGQAQHLAEERRRRLRVAGVDDRVVERDRHALQSAHVVDRRSTCPRPSGTWIRWVS